MYNVMTSGRNGERHEIGSEPKQKTRGQRCQVTDFDLCRQRTRTIHGDPSGRTGIVHFKVDNLKTIPIPQSQLLKFETVL